MLNARIFTTLLVLLAVVGGYSSMAMADGVPTDVMTKATGETVKDAPAKVEPTKKPVVIPLRQFLDERDKQVRPMILGPVGPRTMQLADPIAPIIPGTEKPLVTLGPWQETTAKPVAPEPKKTSEERLLEAQHMWKLVSDRFPVLYQQWGERQKALSLTDIASLLIPPAILPKVPDEVPTEIDAKPAKVEAEVKTEEEVSVVPTAVEEAVEAPEATEPVTEIPDVTAANLPEPSCESAVEETSSDKVLAKKLRQLSNDLDVLVDELEQNGK